MYACYAGGLRGSLVLVQRGGCYVSDKLRSVAAAGAQAALVYNNMQVRAKADTCRPSAYALCTTTF